MRVIVASKSFVEESNWKTEPWFGSRFLVEKLSDEFKRDLNTISIRPELKLSTTNPFLSTDPTKFELISNSQFPILLNNSTEGALWYLSDNLNTSKVSLKLIIKNNHQFYDIQNFALQLLLHDVIKANLEFEENWLDEAGYLLNFHLSYPGLSLFIQGQPEKFEFILMALIQKIKTIGITETKFKYIKEKIN